MKFLKLFATLIFVFSIVVSSIAQQIVWSETKLTWKDFTKRAGHKEFYKSFTNAGISFFLDEKNDIITIEVIAYFNPEESWVHRDFQNDVLLNHEQLHFDITELYARRMRYQMAQYIGMDAEEFARKNLVDKVKKIYKDQYNEMQDEQRRYDAETAHGTNDKEQEKWLLMVLESLVELESFSH